MIHRIANFYGTGEPRYFRSRCGVITTAGSYDDSDVTCEICKKVSDEVVEKVKALMCWADDLAAHMEGDRQLDRAETADFWRQAIEIIS